MGERQYDTIFTEASGEIVEKKSRFICNIYHIDSEDDISGYVDKLKKEHYQARHVCYAAILGDACDVYKYSDDGEPSGTAGRPMLDILKGRGLTYTLACVTRYFGGVLLGTGGLVRAYSDALQEALSSATITTMRLKTTVSCIVDYTAVGKLKYKLDSFKADIVQEEYGEYVTIAVSLLEDKVDSFVDYVTQMTGGKATIEVLQTQFKA